MKPLRTLRQCLIDTALPQLRVIARLWGIEVKAKRPLEVAAELAQSLVDPVHAAEMWQALPAEGRTALTALLETDGSMPVAAFTRRFGEIRPMGPGRLERESPWRNPVSPAEILWYRGLIHEGFVGKASETYPVFFVPAELRAAMPVKAEKEPVDLQLQLVPAPAFFRTGSDLFLDDLTTILAFVHNDVVRPKAGSPVEWPVGSRHALARYLHDPDPERLNFMLYVIEQLGWVRISDDGRLRLAAEPVVAWLQGAEDESLDRLVDAWRQVREWDELWQLTDLQPDDAATWHHDPLLARAALLCYLDALAPDEWVRIVDFIAAIKTSDPDFQRPGGDYETWYIRDAASGEFLSGFECWDRVEGALLRALLEGPAYWLGLVELGSEREGAPPHQFRLRVRAGLGSRAEPPSPVVRPDLTIVMPGSLRFDRFQLARVADLVGMDQAYLYRVTPGALGRARQQRIEPEKVLGFLDGLSDTPVPNAVRSILARWAQQGTEVWLERMLLLRVADEELMQQILASPRSGRFIRRVVAPTAAAVLEKDWRDLVAALAELGWLTELIDLDDA